MHHVADAQLLVVRRVMQCLQGTLVIDDEEAPKTVVNSEPVETNSEPVETLVEAPSNLKSLLKADWRLEWIRIGEAEIVRAGGTDGRCGQLDGRIRVPQPISAAAEGDDAVQPGAASSAANGEAADGGDAVQQVAEGVDAVQPGPASSAADGAAADGAHTSNVNPTEIGEQNEENAEPEIDLLLSGVDATSEESEASNANGDTASGVVAGVGSATAAMAECPNV